MPKTRFLLWSCQLLVVLSTGCSTDVDLNAPYEERTLAFCLLDPNADEQWVRVNRTWLGEGNNLEFAQVADSSEYAPGEVSVTVEAFAAAWLSTLGEETNAILIDILSVAAAQRPDHPAVYHILAMAMARDLERPSATLPGRADGPRGTIATDRLKELWDPNQITTALRRRSRLGRSAAGR